MLFKKLGRDFRSIFKKQAGGVNKIFSKVADGLDSVLPGRAVKSLINSQFADAVARSTGTTGALGLVRKAIPLGEYARDGARAGAEVGSIYGQIADKGLTPQVKTNSLERVAKILN
tara:strand:- start:4130 stop:4477 length:348 start_codon:yes stop_codon:yes gene_type:complete